MDQTVSPAITPCLPLPRKRSPDGASPDRSRTFNCRLLLIYLPERMKGWVGLVDWPITDGLPT